MSFIGNIFSEMKKDYEIGMVGLCKQSKCRNKYNKRRKSKRRKTIKYNY